MFTKIKAVYLTLKNKAVFPRLFYNIFNRSNLNKVIIIFTFGLISRIFIVNFYNINVFTEYLNIISIIYYSFFSLFIVIIHEMVNYFNINIIPQNITDISSHLVNLYNQNIKIFKLIFNTLKSPFYMIKALKLEDLKPSSIIRYINFIYTATEDTKITMATDNTNTVVKNIPESKDKPLIPSTLNMEGDFNLYDSDRNSSDISSINSRPENSNVARNNPNNEALLFRVDTIKESSDLESLALRTPSSSDAHSIASQGKVPTYLADRTRAPMPSGFTTPETMSPLFGNSRNPSIEYANTQGLTSYISYESNKAIVGLNGSNEGIWRNRFPSGSDMQATDWTQRRQIAELNMRQANIDHYEREIAPSLTDVRLPKEVEVKKGIFGKIKLAFNLIDSKLEAKISNMDSIAVKYHDSSKRKFYWTIWEKKSGNYASYEDFKQSWDPKTNIWKEIKSRTNNDVRADVEGILGVGRNRNQLNSLPRRGLQGRNVDVSIGVNQLIRERQPFTFTELPNLENNNTVENQETSHRRNKNRHHTHRKHTHRRNK